MNSAREVARISRARQRLNQGIKYLEQLLVIFQGRSPLVQGSLYKRKYQCGKRSCRCRKGKLHTSSVFSVNQGGKTQLLSLKNIKNERLEEYVKNYRHFRWARAEAVKTFNEMLKEIDKLRNFRKVDLKGVCV